jgi:hypothetical protein
VQTSHHAPTRHRPTKLRATSRQRRAHDRAAGKAELRRLVVAIRPATEVLACLPEPKEWQQ